MSAISISVQPLRQPAPGPINERQSHEHQDSPTFFFLHIRKTAGTSLRGLLANRFPANSILFQAHSVSGPQQPGDALFATGHVGFDYAQRFRVAPKTFTVMREPISLALSGYYFFQKHDEQFFRVLESA